MLPPAPRIGDLQLGSPLIMAPLSGRTDVAFRMELRRLGGAALASTDLVNPQGVLRRNLKTSQILATCEADRPLVVQIYGAEAGLVAEAARHLEGELSPAAIDINMGCPVWKVTRKGGGSALLAEPEKAVRLAERVVGAVSRPVTVKLRLGVDAGQITAPELAVGLREAGVAALTVHGRTAEQRYSGPVDHGAIRRVVEAVPGLPVFANGDVTSPAAAGRMLEATGAAGLAIGRAALRNPWIFNQIIAEAEGRPAPEPSRAERVGFMLGHFRRMLEIKGQRTACYQFRKWVSQYGKALAMTREQRGRFLGLSAPGELEELAAELATA